MTLTLVISVIGLIFFLLFLLYRIGIMAGIYNGSQNSLKNFGSFNSWIFLGFFLLGIYLIIRLYRSVKPDLIGAPSSEHGIWIDSTISLTLTIILVIFFLTQTLLVLFIVLYRYNPKRKALFYPMNLKLEMVWTLIPLVIFLGLFVNAFITWTKVMQIPPENPVIVEIIGMQFNWIARYPGADNELGDVNLKYLDRVNVAGLNLNDPASLDDIVTGEIRVPVDRDVLFKIRSLDVIHSVFIPHFRLKMDAVPGMPTQFSFKPIRTTSQMKMETGNAWFNFSIYCAELCGRGHFNMKADVVVEDAADYEAWIKGQGSWLARNREHIAKIPEKYREKALRIIENTPPETTEKDADFFYDVPYSQRKK